MTRIHTPPSAYRPVAAVVLAVAVLAYVGCSQPGTNTSQTPVDLTETKHVGPAEAETSQAPKPKQSPSAPLKPATAEKAPTSAARSFVGWPKPAGTLVISGEQLGYLEPCGCTSGQLGGIIRRSNLVERLRETKKWPVVLVDLGGLVKDPVLARGGPDQAKVKFYTALKALGVMKYDALGLSAEDLKVGVDEAFGQFLNLPEAGPKVVVANVVMPGLEAKVVPLVRTKAGEVRVGITAVIDPESLRALKDPSLEMLLQIKPIDESLPAVYADLAKDTQTQVLLVQGPPNLANELAKKYPGFDIVVGTSPQGSDAVSEPDLVNGGKTMIVRVGQRGKYAGVVGLFPDATPAYRYERIALDPSYDGPANAVKKLIEDEFRETLKQQQVVENYPRHDYVSTVNGGQGAKFVGVDACKKCHPNTVEFWSTTKHAHAFQSLVDDKKPNTIFDAECVACHTTGFEYNSGWKSPTLSTRLNDNQCENCHGPASKHVENPTDKDSRAPLHLTADLADKNRLCLRCHDEDNSPKFDFAKYWPEVEHNGLDTPRKNLKAGQ